MMTFLHLYMKFTQPLFIQGLMGLKGLYEAKPVALYIFAEGDLKRPFKQPPSILGGKFHYPLCFSKRGFIFRSSSYYYCGPGVSFRNPSRLLYIRTHVHCM
jgi:Phosphate transport (Pho88)